MKKHKYIVLILWCIFTFLCGLHIGEISLWLCCGQYVTAGEIMAIVTSTEGEIDSVLQYAERYVLLYWIIGVVIYIGCSYLFYKALEPNKKIWMTICWIIFMISAIPFLLPIRYNIFREAIYVKKQLNLIFKEKAELSQASYNAQFKGRNDAEIYVLSIGESLRYKNISLNGIYPRQTTPMLKRQTNLCLYSDYYANATLTQHALPLLFTPTETSDFNGHFNYKTIASAFSETGFTTALVSHRAQLMNNGYHNYLAQDFDTIVWVEHDSLIAPIMAQLAEQKQKLFVVTHYLGNHMFYTNRTEDCLMWRPDYNADTKTKSDSLFLNAYDNSILYTDRLLSESIDALRKTNAFVTWLFVSDHGEYIGIRNCGHGHTYHPTKEEYHVPLMVWYSDEYKEAYPNKVANMMKHKDEPVCADHVFWSVLDMAGIRIDSTLQQEGMSIFGDTLLPHQRTLLLPDGKSIMQLD